MPEKNKAESREFLNFDWDFCGQEKIVNFLETALTSDNLAQSYLFLGPRELGKYTLAERFLKILFCRADQGAVPCGQCSDCRQLTAGVHPDVSIIRRELDDKKKREKKEIAVDQIRNLKVRLSQTSLLSGYKAAIIDEAEELSLAAANALLKFFEEPTPKTVIILVAASSDWLPETIISRSQVFRFLPVGRREIEKYLHKHQIAENGQLARLARGRPGLAWKFAKDSEFQEGYFQEVSGFFNLLEADLNRRFELLKTAVNWSSDLIENEFRLDRLFDIWQGVIRDLLLAKNGNQPLIINFDHQKDIEKFSRLFSFAKLTGFLAGLAAARSQLRQNLNPQLVLENLMITL